MARQIWLHFPLTAGGNIAPTSFSTNPAHGRITPVLCFSSREHGVVFASAISNIRRHFIHAQAFVLSAELTIHPTVLTRVLRRCHGLGTSRACEKCKIKVMNAVCSSRRRMRTTHRRSDAFRFLPRHASETSGTRLAESLNRDAMYRTPHAPKSKRPRLQH